MRVSDRMKNVAFELACLADVAPAGISSPELAQISSRILAAAYQVELGEVSIVVCPNCDTDLPKGCSGTFKDEGDACWLNRASQETVTVPVLPISEADEAIVDALVARRVKETPVAHSKSQERRLAAQMETLPECRGSEWSECPYTNCQTRMRCQKQV